MTASLLSSLVSSQAYADGEASGRVYLPLAVQPYARPASPPATSDLRIARLSCIAEVVQIDNDSDKVVELEGWILESARAGRGTQQFVFPAYRLLPGQSVFVHSGPQERPVGENHLHWTRRYIWNDDGDRADLFSPDGALVSQVACWQSVSGQT